MDTTTLNTIRQHIIDNERQPEWAYLDPKGNVTIGTGFHIKTEKEFISLPLINKKTGETATDTEKRQAWDIMQQEKARAVKSGDLNRKADAFRELTNVHMPEAEQNKRLDQEIATRVAKIKNDKDVGEEAWNMLTLGQKAVAVDLHYATGSLDDFKEYKKAIKRGDAQAMAKEALFFTDKKKGHRDEDRLVRNRRAITGEDEQTARKNISDQIKAKKDDDTSGDNPSGDNSPSDAQKQSVSATDPEPGLDIKKLTPEQNLLLKDFDKNDGPLDDILAKDPRDLTQEEFLELKKEVVRLPAGPEQVQLDGMAMEFLEDKFGTGPAKVDAVGRMINPEPIRPINKSPVPAKTPDGEPLQGALKRIGKAVAGAAGIDGNASAVQDLQTGFNILKQVMGQGAKDFPGRTPGMAPDLKTDGVVGPKTRQALKVATSRLGRPKIEEGLALGRFRRFAQDVQTGRDDTRKLGATIGNAFGPLFRNPQPSTQRPIRTTVSAVENLPFQSTINDLGFKAFGQDTFKPILEDGLIGPKTKSAFQAVLPAAGADAFTNRLGQNFGFFDNIA